MRFLTYFELETGDVNVVAVLLMRFTSARRGVVHCLQSCRSPYEIPGNKDIVIIEAECGFRLPFSLWDSSWSSSRCSKSPRCCRSPYEIRDWTATFGVPVNRLPFSLWDSRLYAQNACSTRHKLPFSLWDSSKSLRGYGKRRTGCRSPYEILDSMLRMPAPPDISCRSPYEIPQNRWEDMGRDEQVAVLLMRFLRAVFEYRLPDWLSLPFSLWDSVSELTKVAEKLGLPFSLWDSRKNSRKNERGHTKLPFSLWDSLFSVFRRKHGKVVLPFSLWDS